MKRILIALAIATMSLPLAQEVRADSDVSIDFFYNNLNDGNWVEVDDYGYCWQPNVSVNNSDWRPYSDGYWAYTDVGWTWVSNEDFGWATYHYGRWLRLEGQGWVWVPGYEWGPAWVSWRTGGDYVGWAPLPPTRQHVYEGRAITGHVDVEFDIGPLYYNFVDVRYIGEPVLRERLVPWTQNVTVIYNTVNVTNITYNNSVVYNYGPDYDRVSRYSVRPVQRLTLQRETNANLTTGVTTQAITKVEGQKLVVAAPQKIQQPPKPVAPKNVKAKVAQAKIERGWSGVKDPQTKNQLVQKMKSEDAKKIPPPTMTPNPQAGAGASPAGAAPPSPVATVSPATVHATATPARPAAAKATMTPNPHAGAGASPVGAAPPSPVATVSPATVHATAAPARPVGAKATMTPREGEEGSMHGLRPPVVAPPITTSGDQDQATRAERAHRGQGKRAAGTPTPSTSQNAMEENGRGKYRARGKAEQAEGVPAATPRTIQRPDVNGAGAAPASDEQPTMNKGGRQRQRANQPAETDADQPGHGQGRHQQQNELAPTGQADHPQPHKGRANQPHVQGQPPTSEGQQTGGHQKKKAGEASPTPQPQ
jgi:hypothetical protein